MPSTTGSKTSKNGGHGGGRGVEEKEKEKKPFDLIRRGVKEPTPAGTLTFIGLRLADIPLQRALLAPSTSGLGVRLLSSLGLRTIFTHTSTSVPASLVVPIKALASPPALSGTTTQHLLSPDRSTSLFSSPLLGNLSPTGLILLLMSAGSAAKQIYWLLFIRQESFPASAAASVSGYNTFVNSLNSLLFVSLATSSVLSSPRLTIPSPFSSSSGAISHITLPLSTVLGAALYVVGMTIETVSERQRAVFKAAPENEGKVCKVGLWRWARHINYFGYALWRGGYAMVATGWLGGLAMGLWQGWDLSSRAVLALDTYCAERYGEQWAQFKREVPYKIVPGIY